MTRRRHSGSLRPGSPGSPINADQCHRYLSSANVGDGSGSGERDRMGIESRQRCHVPFVVTNKCFCC